MSDYLKFYIDGRWVDPVGPEELTSQSGHRGVAGRIALGSAADVDRAVAAARRPSR